MRRVKKHIGLIIILIIIVAFPTSLSNQTKLNMRVVVTGIAVDKTEDEFEVTAQIVKTPSGSKGAGTSASVDFISDKGKTVAAAVSKLAFKAGKSAAFSHTNYVILGKDMLGEDLTKDLDYFIRDKIIKNSALVLFAKEKASDEIKNTKSTDLSVGIGLQQVFLFKEYESDGKMVTMMDFLNSNRSLSKTATASEFSLETNEESQKQSSASSGGSQSESSQSGNSGGEGDQSSQSQGGSGSGGGSESGGDSGSSGGSGGGSGGSSESKYFKAQSPILCFVSGKFVGKFETEDETAGFMLSQKEPKAMDIYFESSSDGVLKGAKIEVNIKNMRTEHKVRFENNSPCIDVKIKIYNAEINEILSDEIVASLDDKEYETAKKDLAAAISEKIAKCFEKSKEFKADIFSAYEKAYKYHYKTTKNNYNSREDFLEKLKLSVSVDVNKLDY